MNVYQAVAIGLATDGTGFGRYSAGFRDIDSLVCEDDESLPSIVQVVAVGGLLKIVFTEFSQMIVELSRILDVRSRSEFRESERPVGVRECSKDRDSDLAGECGEGILEAAI
jgi:hypothetical protein